MIKEVKLASDYIHHVATSMNAHGAHSPFLYDLLEECVYRKHHEPLFDKLEAIRGELKRDHRTIAVTDMGEGSMYDGRSHQRTVSFITKKFSKPPRLCRLLYRLTNYLTPSSMLELGTSMGFSAMYQAAGNPVATLTTVEGCPETHRQALENISRAGIPNINAVNASFDEYIPVHIEKHGYPAWTYIDGSHNYESTIRYFNMLRNDDDPAQIMVFDDINWSDGMKEAWQEICDHESTTMTINLFFIGIVLFRDGLSKQNFRVRFL